MLRFVDGSYKPASRSSTIGAFFLTKRITVNNITCKVLIWDTAGQEKFQKLTVTYYQNAAAAIICYDVSNPSGLTRLRKNLEELAKYQQSKPLVLVVAACKCDLLPVPRMEEEAQKLAASYNAMYMETSAKTNRGVSDLFLRTAAKVLETHELAVQGQARPLPVTVGSAVSSSVSRLSPTGKVRSTGFQVESINGTNANANSTTTPTKAVVTDHDSASTENESDEVMEEQPNTESDNKSSPSNKQGPVTCEGSYLVCGVEDAGRACVIL